MRALRVFCAAIALAALFAASSTSVVVAAGPRTGTATPSMTISAWLASGRADIVAGIRTSRWADVLGQYLKETAPGFLSRPDIARTASWLQREGQWLRENEPAFWQRADIHAAWFGRAPSKPSVIGQLLKERGASAYLPAAPALRTLLLSGNTVYYGERVGARWTGFSAAAGFESIAAEAALGGGTISEIAATVVGGSVVAVVGTNGPTAHVYTAIRSNTDGAWSITNLATVAALPQANYYYVAAAGIGEILHVLVVLGGPELSGHLFYAQRSATGSWTDFTDVTTVAQVPGGFNGAVAAVAVGGNLAAVFMTSSGVFISTRDSTTGAWSAVTAGPAAPAGRSLGMPVATSVGADLHVLTLAGDGHLYYAIRRGSTGTWTGFTDLSTLATVPTTENLRAVGMAGLGRDVGVVLATYSGNLYDATRRSSGAWDGFHVVPSGVGAPGDAKVACAGG